MWISASWADTDYLMCVRLIMKSLNISTYFNNGNELGGGYADKWKVPTSGAPENDGFVTAVARGDRCLSLPNSAESNLWRCSLVYNVAACWNVFISEVLGPKQKMRQSYVLPVLPPAWYVIWASNFILLYFIFSIVHEICLPLCNKQMEGSYLFFIK